MNRGSYSAMIRATRNYFRLDRDILIALFAMGTLFATSGNNFLTKISMMNLLRTCATNYYLAIGVQLAIILASIDLTGGALTALSEVMCVMTFESFGLPVPMGIAVGILAGTFVGLINGVIVTYIGIHPLVVTLAMQSICRGAAYLIANGSSVTTENTNSSAFGTGPLGVVPYPVIYIVIFLIVGYFLLNKLRTGRHIYVVSRNELFARFSGIDIRKIKILVQTINGTIAGLCGVAPATRLSSGQPSTGEGYETDTIATAIPGGTSFFSGTGTIGGLMIGVLIIGVIPNGLNLMHVNSCQQFVLKGMIIIAAVCFGILKQKKQNASK